MKITGFTFNIVGMFQLNISVFLQKFKTVIRNKSYYKKIFIKENFEFIELADGQ